MTILNQSTLNNVLYFTHNYCKA